MSARLTGAVVVLVAGLGACDVLSGLLESEPPEGAEVVTDGSGDGATHQVSALPEVEPNGTREQAMRLPTGRPVAGAITGDDLDVFLVSAALQAADLVVEGTGITGVDVFRPQDAAGYTVPAVDGAVRVSSLGRGASLLVTVRGQGEYRIRVDDSDAPAACGFAREPDDIANPGVVLTSVPATGVGCVPTPDDLDVFALPSGAWEDAPGFGLSVSAVPGLAADVRVKDHVGRVLARLTGEEGVELLFPNLAVPPEGDLFIEVRSHAGANETEPYRLTLRRLPALNGMMELEPNDEPERATVLDTIGLVNGYIHQSGDVDRYHLVTPEPRLVRLLAESPEGVDLEVEVTGGVLGSLVIDDGGIGEQEQLCSVRVDAEDGFDFSVRAESFQRTGAEPYLLHFELLEGTNWEVEPNDTAAEALDAAAVEAPAADGVGIRLGDSASPFANGYAFPPGDVDQYVVEVYADPAAAATYQSVTIRLEPNAPSNYALELVDEDGAAVAVSDSGTMGEAELISLDLPAGRYLAKVSFVDGEACARPYRLSVQQTDFPVLEVPAVVPALPEGSGEEAPPEGSGMPIPIAPVRQRPRLNIAPPPTAPRIEGRPAPSPAPRTWDAPTPGAGEQPPTFGGSSGR